MRNHGPSHYDGRRLLERLFAHRVIDPATGCWLWAGLRNKKGYGFVQFTHKGRRHPVTVHRLVAWLYLNYNGERRVEVCHRCNVQACFNPAHLYVATHQQNMMDAVRDGRTPYRRGARHYEAKVTEADVVDIRRLIKSGMTYREVALSYKLHVSSVKDMVKRRTWKHVPEVASDA